MEERVLAYVMITPDGTELVSKHVHDYVEYTDTQNGKWYMVDGGTDYFKYGESPEFPGVKKTITTNSPFEDIRNYFHWGTYGPKGDYLQPEWKKLKDLGTDHIKAILETQVRLPEYKKQVFKAELAYRESNK